VPAHHDRASLSNHQSRSDQHDHQRITGCDHARSREGERQWRDRGKDQAGPQGTPVEHRRPRGTHGGQRTRLVTIDELVTLAEALSMPPAALMPELGSVGERGIRLETVRLIDDLIRQLKDLRDRCAATAGRP
jgi:hypothetical protein